MRSTFIRLVTLAALLEVFPILTRRLGDLRAHLVQVILLFLFSSIVYIVSTYLILQIEETGNPGNIKSLWMLIAAAAVLFRLTVWPVPY